MEKGLTRPGAPGGFDAKAIESFVARGDWSGLDPHQRALAYTKVCEQHGLNPLSQPFAFLRLNGKEVLYATRGATDQLAAMHRLTRKIVDGPKVVDIAGTKVALCVAEATHPNGRSETATATLPLVDPVNLFMKLETKAKRRVTLSILGLGVLDEQELDTIPEAVKGDAPQVDPAQLAAVASGRAASSADPSPAAAADEPEGEPEAEGPSSRAFSAFCDAIIKAPSLAEVHNLYNGLVDDLREEGNDPEHFTQGDDGAGVKAFARMAALGHRLSREESGLVLRDRPFAEVLDTQAHVTPGPDALKVAARWWIDRRSDRATLDQAYQKKPWLPLVRRYSGATDGPKVKAAGAALEAAIKTMEPKPPAGGGNGGARASNDAAHGGGAQASGNDGAAAATSDVFEALALRGSGDVLLAWATKLRDTPQTGDDRGAGHVAGSYWKRRDAWKAVGLHARAYALTLDELACRGVAEPHTFLDGVGERNGATTRSRHLKAA